MRLADKMDKLTALARSSFMCFTETWMIQDINHNNFSLKGFQIVRADQDAACGW